jgi:hypothetical protein
MSKLTIDQRLKARAESADEIRQAYRDARAALQQVGKLLRTTEAGRYMWSARHKTIVSGLVANMGVLERDVPCYQERNQEESK